MGEWCKHYRATADNETCKIGIVYKTVVGSTPERPGMALPCWGDNVQTCASVVYPTAEEVAAHNAEIAILLNQFQVDLDNDICPHCKTPIAQWNQVGRCVYAAPCGCRLYQGKVPDRHRKRPR